MYEIKLILDGLKKKSKNIASFKTRVYSSDFKEQIHNYVKVYYSNITEYNSDVLLALYYSGLSNIRDNVKCPYCNNVKKYQQGLIFSKTCGSKECLLKSKRDTSLIKFGKIHYSQTTECKERLKQTNLDRYGVENVFSSEEIKEKIKDSNVSKYGSEYYMQSDDFKKKSKNTLLDKYGVDNITKSEYYNDKVKQINLSKYGSEYYMQSDDFKQKSKNTLLDKYGVDNIMKSEYYNDKVKYINLSKYGSEYYMQSDDFKQKSKNTNLTKYGVEYYSQSDECKDKVKNTNLTKYGVEYYSQSDECKDKVKNIFAKKRIDKYKDIIKNNNLNIRYIDEKDIYICGSCGFEFNDNDDFIRDRFSYFPYIICPKCNPKGEKQTSQHEQELLTFVKDLLSNIRVCNRYFIGNKEVDIYIPDMNLAFEFNGLYWHSEIHKDKYYHRNKTKAIREYGVNLIHVWEDDWIYKNEIVKSRIRNLLGKTENKIYGRNTEVKEINFNDCKQFLDENHIQGCGVGNIRYGLFFGDELVSVIQVDKSGLLSRFANKLNTNVIGGFSKLFKYVEKYIKYTFIDLDWSSENNIYSRYMKFDSYVEPTWYLLYKGKRVHRRNFQKKKLLQMGMGSPEQTEHEITLENKLYRIYNSGNIKYVKQNS